MWNVLLDKLPTEYNGYPIDSAFQTGLQMFQALNDKELSEKERILTAISLLFPNKKPDITTCQEAVEWFLIGWRHDKSSNKKEKIKATDYDIDQWRIYSAFRSQYGINLNKDTLHFWEFMGLLTTLDDCAYTRIIDIRTRKFDKKMSAEAKEALKQAKEMYSLEEEEEELSQEEMDIVEQFMKYTKNKR